MATAAGSTLGGGSPCCWLLQNLHPCYHGYFVLGPLCQPWVVADGANQHQVMESFCHLVDKFVDCGGRCLLGDSTCYGDLHT